MPAKRKTSPLVWVLVVILGLLVLGGIGVIGTVAFVAHKIHQAGIDPELWQRNPGLAASKMIAAVNPNVEIVRVNDADNTITMRDKRNGRQWTMSFNDVKNGGFHMKMSGDDNSGGQGSFEIGGDASKLPSWVPQYPGSKPEVAITGSSNQGTGGTFSFSTPDSAQDVMKFYQDKATELGLKTDMVVNTAEGGSIAASEPNGRGLNVSVGQDSGHTRVTVIYGSK